jgi:hypothetical protein
MEQFNSANLSLTIMLSWDRLRCRFGLRLRPFLLVIEQQDG